MALMRAVRQHVTSDNPAVLSTSALDHYKYLNRTLMLHNGRFELLPTSGLCPSGDRSVTSLNTPRTRCEELQEHAITFLMGC